MVRGSAPDQAAGTLPACRQRRQATPATTTRPAILPMAGRIA